MMNDDIERRLGRLTLQDPPPELRSELIARALSEPATEPPPTPWWRELFWPCPQAWAGMAATWILMIAMQFGTEPAPEFADGRDPEITMMAARVERELLIDEYFRDPEDERPAAKVRKPAVDRPRSQRRKDAVGFA